MAGRLSETRPGARPFFTIGHSDRTVEELTGLLREAGAEMVVDVRTLPRSRANPQFNSDTLGPELATRQIGYRHMAALGGLRGRQSGTSPNDLWRNASFRNYADYALTPAFRDGLAELMALGEQRSCAVMCAETLWWRCHRRIIADYLLASGAEVMHILGPGDVKPASPTPGVTETAGGLVYRAQDGSPTPADGGNP